MIGFQLAALFCLPAAASDLPQLKQKARELRLADETHWLRLLHYRRNLIGVRESEQDAPEFFLSPRGKRDAQAELDATLDAFFSPLQFGTTEQHPQCRYPARYDWLKSRLDFAPDSPPAAECPELEKWLGNLNGQSLQMIFASGFMNNPASMYGHTFLRLDQERELREGSSLLSYSINFAAETQERSGFFFAAKGLFGLYPGKFTTVPYYMKIQQYSNLENRDLWEYRLNLSAAQIRTLLLHLWELGPASFNYYFLTENCSYQLLPLLEVADDRLSMSRRFRFKAIPIDTVRVTAEQPGLVTATLVRPSAVKKMIAARERLAEPEVRAAETMARDLKSSPEELLGAVDEPRRPLVLQTAYQYFRYRQGNQRYLPPEADAHERKFLLLLNKMEVEPEVSVREGTEAHPPERGHRTGRAAFSYGNREGEPFAELGLRAAMHDLLDAPSGYVPHSRLEMFHLRMRAMPTTEKFVINEFTLFDILSISPLDRWVKRPSWGVALGTHLRKDAPRQNWDATYGRFIVKSGASYALERWGRTALFYGLAQLDTNLGPAFDGIYRAGGGGIGGLNLELARRARLSAEADYRNYFAGEEKSVFGFRVTGAFDLTARTQLRATYEQEDRASETQLSFLLYY